jgi:hypothetical protein
MNGNWNPWAGTPENYRLSIADLVANGTLDAEIAGTLWAAADEELSFLTVAMPRGAGKTTVGSAILGLRRPDVALHLVLAEPRELQALREQRLGGYVVVGELSPYRMPSYIWGPPVRDVFETLEYGYSLQTSLHATGVEPAIREVTAGNGVSDAAASHLQLVVYIEVLRGADGRPVRRVAEVFEVDRVVNGAPEGRTLHRWQPLEDRFESVAEPSQFGQDRALLTRRREAIAGLVERGRTSVEDVGALVREFVGRGHLA